MKVKEIGEWRIKDYMGILGLRLGYEREVDEEFGIEGLFI